MNKALLERLWFGKEGSLSQLAESDAAAVRRDADALRLLALNSALQTCAAQPAPWPVPAREGLLNTALGSGDSATHTTRRSRAVLRPQQRASKRWLGYALAVVVLALAVLGVVQAVRLGVGSVLRRAVAPAGVAWAEVDGYVLEYPLTFDDYFSGTALDPPDHPVWRLNDAVKRWAADNGVAFLTDGDGPRVQFELDNYEYGRGDNQGKYTATVRIRLLGAEQELKDSLLETLAQLPGLSKPQVYSQTMYYSEKYPETMYPGRKLVINGVSYVYPGDFTEEEAKNLWRYMVGRSGDSYVAFLKLGEGRIPLGDIVRVQMGDTPIISDYVKHFDRSELKLHSFEQQSSIYIPEDEVNLDFDPVKILESVQSQWSRSKYTEVSKLSREGVRYVVDLQQQDSDEQRKVTARKLKQAYLSWSKEYPELAPDGELSYLVEYGMVELQGRPAQWQLALWINDVTPRQQLEADLQSVTDCGIRVWPAKLSYDQGKKLTVHVAHGPGEGGTVITYTLVPTHFKYGKDFEKAAEETPESVKQNSQRIKERLFDAFNKYSTGRVYTSLKDSANIGWQEIGGVVFQVYIFTGTRDQRKLAEITDALKVEGAPEPKISFRDNEAKITGVALQVPIFPLERFVGLSPEDISSHFSKQEFGAAEAKLAQISEAIDAWQARQGSESLESAKLITDMYVYRFGSLALGESVTTALTYGEQLDDLVDYLESVTGQKVGVWEPGGYNAGPSKSPHPELPRPTTEELQRQILVYDIGLDRADFAYPLSSRAELLGKQDWDHLNNLISSMRSAVAEWNEHNPPNASVGEERFTLKTSELAGVPNSITIFGNRTDEETVQSLAQALKRVGAPEYREGFGYQNRNTPGIGKTTPYGITGTYWTYRLVPQVSWMGKSVEEVSSEFTEDEKRETKRTEEQLRSVFDSWLAQHPELKDPGEIDLGEENTASFHSSSIGGVVIDVNLRIVVSDDKLRKQLVDELIQWIERETGLKRPARVDDYTGTSYK